MIMRKTWEKDKVEGSYRTCNRKRYHDVYTGYFLFGFIPLYINRDRRRKN